MKNKSRVKAFIKEFPKDQIDALLIEQPIDIFYLTGMELSTGTLFVTREEAFLLVDGRYFERAKKLSPAQALLKEENSLEQLMKRKKKLGFHKDATSYQRYLELKKLKGITLIPLDNLVERKRMIKDKEEIDKLRNAATLGSRGYDFVRKLLKVGISEKEVAAALEIFWLREGGDRLAFDPIIAFGSNTSMPHYRPSDRKLKKGEPVLIDIGVSLDHYKSDMTRVLFFGGSPSKKMKEIYQIVKEAQESALRICKPGATVGALDLAARDLIRERGYGEYFTHGLGHGVGLEIHEAPYLKSKGPYKDFVLQKGMVITIEPGIYLPGIGGVRLENTIVITKDGFEDLTQREI